MNIEKAIEQEYLEHMGVLKEAYPKDMAKAQQLSLETARKIVEEQTANSLPEGCKTPGQHFYTLKLKDNSIGHLWLTEKDNCLFVSDIYLYPDYRSRGYGSEVLCWIKQKANELDYKAVWLHVFGHNQKAVSFYEKQGFRATNLNMRIDV